MAVEQPDSRVVAAEPQHHITVGVDQNRVASHGHGGRCASLLDRIASSVLFGAFNDLECVSVKMEWMFLNYLARFAEENL